MTARDTLTPVKQNGELSRWNLLAVPIIGNGSDDAA